MRCLNCEKEIGDEFGQSPLCDDCLRLPIGQIVIRIFGGTIEEVKKNVSDN